MSGYLDNYGGTPRVLTFSGLTAGSRYDVYVYDLESVNGRGGTIDVNGVDQVHTAATSTAYVQGVNYSFYPNTLVDPSGRILISTTGNDFRVAINGVQLVAVPEPASAVLLGIGSVAVLLGRRRRRAF